jgi:hypothetical protein
MKSLHLAWLALLPLAIFANEITYSQHIRPLWEQRCASCHGVNSPYLGEWQRNKEEHKRQMRGPRMDSYAELLHFIGWPQTGALVRQLDDGQQNGKGKAGGMYLYLGEDEAERQKNLALFKAWLGPDAWRANHWQAKKDMPAITKQELEQLRLAY